MYATIVNTIATFRDNKDSSSPDYPSVQCHIPKEGIRLCSTTVTLEELWKVTHKFLITAGRLMQTN
jgi:hypothetical protein